MLVRPGVLISSRNPAGYEPGRIGSPADAMLADEANGLALSFTDDFFENSSGHYGSARVEDTGTPANNYNSHPFGLCSYPGASVKLVRGPDGTLRYGAHNLCLQSENVASDSWNKANVTVTPAALSAGGYTFDKIEVDSSGNAACLQSVSGAGGVVNAYSIIVRKGSGTADGHRFLLRNVSTLTNLISVELNYDTGAVSGSGAANAAVESLGDGIWKLTLTAATGVSPGNTLAIYVGFIGVSETAGEHLYATRAHLRRLPSDDTYLKTTDSAVYELPYEWDENGDLLGIRHEPQRTNLFLNNRAPATQNITVTAQAYTLSFYGTGSITLSGAHEDTLEGTGEDDRVTLTFTPSAGTLTCTVDGDIDFAQLEAGAFATSPIETAGSQVTRAGDAIGPALAKFPWNDGNGVLTVNDEEVEPSDDGTILLLEPPDGDTHIRTVKWISA